MKSTKLAFTRQKASAKYRGIAFNLTYPEWLSIWDSSGKLERRGRGVGKYVMARLGDSGPYEIGNIEIIQFGENAKDARTNNPRSLSNLRSKQIGTGRGWTPYFNKFQVSVAKRYIGLFSTVEEAEAAYKEASGLLCIEAKQVAGNKPDTTGVERND